MINDTKVSPARLFGVKEDTQAKIEVLLLKRRDNDTWETLVKPGKKCRPGTVIIFGDGLIKGTVTDVVEEGNRTGGIGAELAASFQEELYDELDGPVIRVAALDVPLPYNITMEHYAIPSVESICKAVRAAF